MKLIHLTGITLIPNEKGEEKIKNATDGSALRDGETPTKNWFIEVGLPPPKDAPDDEIDENGEIDLEPEETQEIYLPITIPLDNIGSYIGLEDGTTKVFTKSNMTFEVAETTEDIDMYIEYMQMNWFRKNWLYLQSFFRRKNKEQEITLELE